MRLKIYLCGVYKTDRDMIGRKVIFLSYLFNMYASFCGVALLLCNGNIEEIWVEFVLDLLWTKILYKMLKHTIYILLPPWVKFYLQIKSVLKIWWCVNIHQYKEKCWCSLLLLINWWLYEFGNILEIDLISQGYMLSVSINILCEINLYDCCLDGQDRAVSGLASSSDVKVTIYWYDLGLVLGGRQSPPFIVSFLLASWRGILFDMQWFRKKMLGSRENCHLLTFLSCVMYEIS